MARYEVVQKISGMGFPERRAEEEGWGRARDALLFMIEQFSEQEEAEWAEDLANAQAETEYESLRHQSLVKDLLASMLADTDDPPMIEPESGRWGVTFECYDLSWRNWSIRKL